MLIHGRYSYKRTAWIANYCFYKSLIICLVQIGYVSNENRKKKVKYILMYARAPAHLSFLV